MAASAPITPRRGRDPGPRRHVTNGRLPPSSAAICPDSPSNISTIVDPAVGDLVNNGTIPSISPVATRRGGVPLAPEKSTNYTAGIVFDSGEFSLTADDFRSNVSDRIGITSNFTLTAEEIDTLLAEGVEALRQFPLDGQAAADVEARARSSGPRVVTKSATAITKKATTGGPPATKCNRCSQAARVARSPATVPSSWRGRSHDARCWIAPSLCGRAGRRARASGRRRAPSRAA